MFRALRQDARCLHSLAAPGKPVTIWSLTRLWLVSRSLWLLASHRLTHHYERPQPQSLRERLPFLAAKVLIVIARRAAMIFAKSEIEPSTPFEPGVVLPDRGHVVAGARFIGSGTVIDTRTTIGMNLTADLKPWIGRDVWIGSHCVVYGDIRIGDGATILPHTVLTRSVPEGAIVAGNPARSVGNDPDRDDLRRRHFRFGDRAFAGAVEGAD